MNIILNTFETSFKQNTIGAPFHRLGLVLYTEITLKIFLKSSFMNLEILLKHPQKTSWNTFYSPWCPITLKIWTRLQTNKKQTNTQTAHRRMKTCYWDSILNLGKSSHMLMVSKPCYLKLLCCAVVTKADPICVQISIQENLDKIKLWLADNCWADTINVTNIWIFGYLVTWYSSN